MGRREKRRRAEVENGGSKEEDVDESMQGTDRGEKGGEGWMDTCDRKWMRLQCYSCNS